MFGVTNEWITPRRALVPEPALLQWVACLPLRAAANIHFAQPQLVGSAGVVVHRDNAAHLHAAASSGQTSLPWHTTIVCDASMPGRCLHSARPAADCWRSSSAHREVGLLEGIALRRSSSLLGRLCCLLLLALLVAARGCCRGRGRRRCCRLCCCRRCRCGRCCHCRHWRRCRAAWAASKEGAVLQGLKQLFNLAEGLVQLADGCMLRGRHCVLRAAPTGVQPILDSKCLCAASIGHHRSAKSRWKGFGNSACLAWCLRPKPRQTSTRPSIHHLSPHSQDHTGAVPRDRPLFERAEVLAGAVRLHRL